MWDDDGQIEHIQYLPETLWVLDQNKDVEIINLFTISFVF